MGPTKSGKENTVENYQQTKEKEEERVMIKDFAQRLTRLHVRAGPDA